MELLLAAQSLGGSLLARQRSTASAGKPASTAEALISMFTSARPRARAMALGSELAAFEAELGELSDRNAEDRPEGPRPLRMITKRHVKTHNSWTHNFEGFVEGAGADTNVNGIPDVCEPDCNANGIFDACDIASGDADDDTDGVPDTCQATVVSVDDVVPRASRFVGAYPTPFNPRTTLSLALPTGGQVDLAVHDLRGRRVATLVDESLAAGEHAVTWQARDVPAGTYLYELRAGGERVSGKLVVER